MRAFAGAEMAPLRRLLTMVDSGELEEVEATALGAGETLVGIAAPGIGDDELAYVASRSAPDGPWPFSAGADMVDTRTDLVHVLIRACAEALWTIRKGPGSRRR
jgi:hypothetical protein